jgi:hypothetical protein
VTSWRASWIVEKQRPFQPALGAPGRRHCDRLAPHPSSPRNVCANRRLDIRRGASSARGMAPAEFPGMKLTRRLEVPLAPSAGAVESTTHVSN